MLYFVKSFYGCSSKITRAKSKMVTTKDQNDKGQKPRWRQPLTKMIMAKTNMEIAKSQNDKGQKQDGNGQRSKRLEPKTKMVTEKGQNNKGQKQDGDGQKPKWQRPRLRNSSHRGQKWVLFSVSKYYSQNTQTGRKSLTSTNDNTEQLSLPSTMMHNQVQFLP